MITSLFHALLSIFHKLQQQEQHQIQIRRKQKDFKRCILLEHYTPWELKLQLIFVNETRISVLRISASNWGLEKFSK